MVKNEIQRVVLLRKNLGDSYTSDTPTMPSSTVKWMALGHFDEIYTYDLPLKDSKFFLYSIKMDKEKISRYNDDCVYYHPLYLVGSTQPVVSHEIAEKNFRFIAIVRIHFAATSRQKQDYIDLCNDIKTTCENKKTGIHCNAYHATEFSDMVLDLRSQSFFTLQQFVLKTLRNNPLIGKMYTYFGINSTFLHSEELCEETDRINMLSVRFPSTASRTQIETIKNILSEASPIEDPHNMFSVNGIDDTLISCHEVATNSLLRVYRSFITIGDVPENIKSTTRVGFYIDTPLSSPGISDISKICDNLISLRKDLQIKLGQDGIIPRSWFQMIYESVNTLVRMSKTSVMDEIVYLLVPSMEAFIRNVLDSNVDKINRHVKSYNEFAENNVSLIEQLMRLEGQLSQNPEYRPIICDVPVFMLEYTLAFLGKTTKLLQYSDKGNSHFEFLMMPCSCPEIKARELFPAEDARVGLIQLSIPDHELYSPELILRPLCHELAHNVGDKFRCRDIRKKYYCHAIATLVIANLLNTRNNKEATKKLAKRFENKLINYSHPTILQMSEILRKDVLSLTSKLEGDREIADMGKFIHWYLTDVSDPKPIQYLDRYFLERVLSGLFVHWDDIDYLFREIYADICLLTILKLPADEYVHSLLNIDWYTRNKSIAHEAFAVRIYVTLQVMGKKIPYPNSTKDEEKVSELLHNIQEEIDKECDGKYKLPYSINAIIDLIKYGKKCKNIMDKDLELAEDDVDEVREMYESLAYFKCYPGYDYIVDAIDAYRQDVIATNRS